MMVHAHASLACVGNRFVCLERVEGIELHGVIQFIVAYVTSNSSDWLRGVK